MAKNKKVESAFHEVFHNVPKTVKKTGKTGEAKRKMMVAIALSKARAAGADIPKKHEGGFISESGVYELQKGEQVLPALHASSAAEINLHEHTPGKDRDSMGNNCCVLGDGSKAEHHSHVAVVTPIQTKKKELKDQSLYVSDVERDREKEASEIRRGGGVRPLGGAAKASS